MTIEESASFEQIHFDSHYILKVGCWWEMIARDNYFSMTVRKSIGAGAAKNIDEKVIIDNCYGKQIYTGIATHGKS